MVEAISSKNQLSSFSSCSLETFDLGPIHFYVKLCDYFGSNLTLFQFTKNVEIKSEKLISRFRTKEN